MKYKAIIIFLLLLVVGIMIGIACGAAEERYWSNNVTVERG